LYRSLAPGARVTLRYKTPYRCADERYSGERDLDNPLAAVQMSLIYVAAWTKGQFAGIVMIGAWGAVPVSAIDANIIRKVNARFEWMSRSSIQNQ